MNSTNKVLFRKMALFMEWPRWRAPHLARKKEKKRKVQVFHQKSDERITQ
jgi:hypothetical protein